MSGPACRFCSHRNPERSSFCNACGSPLHLAPCPQCEAINNASDDRCVRCGAVLPAAVAEPVEHEPVVEAAEAAAGSVPIALADRLEEAPLAQAAWSVDEPPAPVEPAAGVDDDLPAVAARAHASDWKPDRLRGILLGVAFVVIFGAVAWTALNAPRALDAITPGTPPTAAPRPAPAEATQPTAAPVEPAQPTIAAPVEQAAPQAPASAQDAPVEADTSPPPTAPSASVETPEPAAPVKAHRTAKTEARAGGETRHANTADSRSREQAERDAIATQRIIARELANAPRAGTSAQPSPTP